LAEAKAVVNCFTVCVLYTASERKTDRVLRAEKTAQMLQFFGEQNEHVL